MWGSQISKNSASSLAGGNRFDSRMISSLTYSEYNNHFSVLNLTQQVNTDAGVRHLYVRIDIIKANYYKNNITL